MSLFCPPGFCLSTAARGFGWKLTYLDGGREGGLLTKLRRTALPPFLFVPGHPLLWSGDMGPRPLLDSMLTPITRICGPCLRLPVDISPPRLHGPHESFQTSALRLVLCERHLNSCTRAMGQGTPPQAESPRVHLRMPTGRDRKWRSCQGVLRFSLNLLGVSVSVSLTLPVPLCNGVFAIGNIFTWMHLLKIFLSAYYARMAFLHISSGAYYLQ